MSTGVETQFNASTGVATVTLSRPPLNLLEPGLIASLHDAFIGLAADDAVRVAVLRAGGRAFSAGMDVSIFRDLDPAAARRLIESLRGAIDAVFKAPFPTVAAIHGACLGGAFELVLACDMRVAGEDATLGLPEVRVGLPSVIHAALLPRMVGQALAAEMLFTGSTLSAARAFDCGLVNQVVPVGELQQVTSQLVDGVLECAPGAVRAQKELLIAWRDATLADAIGLSVDVFVRGFEGGEPREGASAFLEKRAPAWRTD